VNFTVEPKILAVKLKFAVVLKANNQKKDNLLNISKFIEEIYHILYRGVLGNSVLATLRVI
jgi:hypothetical protein